MLLWVMMRRGVRVHFDGVESDEGEERKAKSKKNPQVIYAAQKAHGQNRINLD